MNEYDGKLGLKLVKLFTVAPATNDWRLIVNWMETADSLNDFNIKEKLTVFDILKFWRQWCYCLPSI